MLRRLLTGIALAAAFIAIIWIPPLAPAFALAVAALSALGAREYFALARAKNIAAEETTGIAAIIAIHLAAWLWPQGYNLLFFAAIVAIMAAHLIRGEHTLAGIATSTFGSVYLGWMPGHLILLHQTPQIGPGLVTITAVAIVLCDTGAYFTGRAIGRTPFAPRLSPKKTWEGAIGGIAWTAAAMGILYLIHLQLHLSVFPNWPPAIYFAIGAIIALIGEAGDLLESMLKRDAGVKDSGNLLPGHGGILDRFDSILFAAPLLYYLIQLPGWHGR